MRTFALLSAAALMLAVGAARAADDPIRPFECASVQHHYGNSVEAWHDVMKMGAPDLEQMEAERIRLSWPGEIIKWHTRFYAGYIDLFLRNQAEGHKDRAEELFAIARGLDCEWALNMS